MAVNTPDFHLVPIGWGDLAVGDTLLLDLKRTGIQEHRVVEVMRQDEGMSTFELRNLFTEELSVFGASNTDITYKVVANQTIRKLVTERQIYLQNSEDES